MTTFSHELKIKDIQLEIRKIRKAAQKVAASKATALRFLESMGMHDVSGKLKPQFR